MGRNGRTSLRRVRDELRRAHPSIGNPDAAILLSRLTVGDRPIERPGALVPEGSTIAFVLEGPAA
jgi:hypothetical protein